MNMKAQSKVRCWKKRKRILLLVHTAWNKEKLIQLNDDVSKEALDIKSCCFPFKTETFMLGVVHRIGNAAGSWKECGCRLVSFSLSAATSLARLVGGRLIYSCKSRFLRPTSKLLVYRMRSRFRLSKEATVFIPEPQSANVTASPPPVLQKFTKESSLALFLNISLFIAHRYLISACLQQLVQVHENAFKKPAPNRIINREKI